MDEGLKYLYTIQNDNRSRCVVVKSEELGYLSKNIDLRFN